MSLTGATWDPAVTYGVAAPSMVLVPIPEGWMVLTSDGCAVAVPAADWVIDFFAAGATPGAASIAASQRASAPEYMGIMTTITALIGAGILVPTMSDLPLPTGEPHVHRYTPALPWTGMAVSGTLAADLCRASCGARRVLELGPGVSTELMALMASLTMRRVTILAIEQDAIWASATEAAVALARRAPGEPRTASGRPGTNGGWEPGSRLDIITAALVPYPKTCPFPVSRWYDPDHLKQVAGPFDLMVVDGPTAFRPEWRYDRWPAIELAQRVLAPDGTLVLDDTDRVGEREIANDWLQRLGPAWTSERRGRASWFVRAKPGR